MNKIYRYLLIVIIIFSMVETLIEHKTNAAENIARKIIIFDKKISDLETKNHLINRYGIEKVKDLKLVNGALVTLTKEQELKLKNEKNIIRIEDDINVEALGKGNSTTPTAPDITQLEQVVPWGIFRIKADLLSSSNNGLGVKVAVIDSGIDLTHPDLKDNIKGGYNAISRKGSITDDYGHGTHVAGIIAALNNSIGVVGTSSNVSLYSVKVLNSTGNGYLSDLIEGIEWCITNGIQVINMSLGVADSPSLHDAIIKANQAGIVLVAAAGNNTYESVKYPAAYQEVISVVATDYNNQIGGFCPKGKVDIAAPGVDIYSTYKDGGYINMTGTSMAAPHVAGAAALLLSTLLKGDLNGDGKVTPEEVKKRLQNTSIDLGISGIDDTYGAGLLDVYSTVTQ